MYVYIVHNVSKNATKSEMQLMGWGTKMV